MKIRKITTQYAWSVQDWHNGTWRDVGTVHTWTPTKSIARAHAVADSPALRGCRFRVTLKTMQDVSHLGMYLAEYPHNVQGTPRYIVPDMWGDWCHMDIPIEEYQFASLSA